MEPVQTEEHLYRATPEQSELTLHVRSRMMALYLSDLKLEVAERVYDFNQQLEAKYDRHALRTYELWHTMVGSSLSGQGLVGHDLPGEDSIATFIESMYDHAVAECYILPSRS